MKTRQAILREAGLMMFIGLASCSTTNDIVDPTPTVPPVISSATPTVPPSPIPASLTPTPVTCVGEPGALVQDVLPNSTPPQEFIVYLPPCYHSDQTQRYPVLYLLHGQTYFEDQWVRIGAPDTANRLIHSGESVPFMMVFPDDHYWNAPAGATFGSRLINELIPHVDQTYRTLADPDHRSLGGLSRGGGWTIRLGLNHPDLFGSLGLHSPAIFQDDAPFIESYILNIPPQKRPRLWFDIGDADKELASGRKLEEVLTRTDFLHEFHVFTGDHTEVYWSAQVGKYLRWYTKAWADGLPE